jgi:glycosyltransferase involved in cell wall biosynthesis
VPSRWMETGPLVVLESFAAGTPVIGSDLGGIAEWVQHEQNGLLVAFDDIVAWTNALRRCASDRTLLARLREGVGAPRTMKDVAREMAKLYKQIGPARPGHFLADDSPSRNGLNPNVIPTAG